MYVSDKLKLCFIHIPKTAGDTIKRAMMKVDPKTYQAGSKHGRLNQKFLNQYKDYWICTTVRNSYQIVISMYRASKVKDAGLSEFRPKNNKNFKEWISGSKHYLRVCNQLSYIKHLNDSKILVNQIIDYDKLAEGIQELNKHISYPISIDNIKVHYRGKYNWKDYYTPEMKIMVEKKCKKDINYFKWEF